MHDAQSIECIKSSHSSKCSTPTATKYLQSVAIDVRIRREEIF